MDNEAMRLRVEGVKARAHGHWDYLLGELIPNQKIINRKNQPCPKCDAGEDRFQYTNRYGNGDAYCRHCGHIDGWALLESANQWSFWDAFLAVEQLVGDGEHLPKPAPERANRKSMLALAMKMWAEALPVVRGDEVDRYLRGRGLGMDVYPDTLRSHAGLGYYVKEGEKSVFVRNIPAMLALMQDKCGQAVSLHRTYIEGGHKALVPDPKKCLTSFPPGAAIRLFNPVDELAVAEGIETALAIHRRFGTPVWSAYSATNLEQLVIPSTIRRICIYGDHDASFTGQSAAFALARRLAAGGAKHGAPEVQVFIPKKCGTDWADIWLAMQTRPSQAA